MSKVPEINYASTTGNNTIMMEGHDDFWTVTVGLLAGFLGLAAISGALSLKWMQEWYYESRLDEATRRRLPPGDLGWPVIGNMIGFFKAYKSNEPDSFIRSYTQRFKSGGVYKAFMFGSPAIMLTTAETCKQVLMDDINFVPGWPKATWELMGRKSFVGVFHEEHKRLRKLTSASINGYEALSTYLTFIEETVALTLDRWSKMGEIEFLTEMRRLTFRIIMHIFLSEGSESVLQSLERVYTDLNYGMRALAINIPGFVFHRALKARRKLVNVIQSVLNERRAESQSCSRSRKDMMDNLMDAEDKDGKKLSDEEIIDILLMYLNAGHESSGHITMWATLFLQKHPEIFRKAKEEQEEIRRNLPPAQKGLTLAEIRKMKYLSQVIDETLRLVNISFVSFREALADVEINGYIIPKGWKVDMWYRAVHMDQQLYPNPKEFNPSRWDGVTPKPGTFLPFGGGSRLCPGNDLAKLEISVFLHYFLLDYELVQLNPGSPLRYLPHPRPKDNCRARIVKVHKKPV